MADLIDVEGNGVHARLASRPVSAREYREFLHATGQPVDPTVARTGGGDPAVFVSHVNAEAYCRWLGELERVAYRLPTIAELLALAGDSGLQGAGQEVWPHTHAERPEILGRQGAIYLCEWTRETETVPGYGSERSEPRILGSVFYPPWLRQGNNPKQIQGMMLASQGYSFVAFRVAAPT